MQAWAKRGLRTALVTGGLLMLGTGIASADEDVNPDKPASPLDVKIDVPIHVGNNALGTPLGQRNIPDITKNVDVAPGDVVTTLPVANQAAPAAQAKVRGTTPGVAAPVLDKAKPVTDTVTGQATPLAGKVTDQTGPLTDKVSAATGKAGLPGLPQPRTPNLPEVDGGLRGNSVDGDVVIPVDLSGNAIAVLGKAHVENESHQHHGTDESVVTDGRSAVLAGNAVDLDWTLPVQVTGNAVAAGGKATAENESHQETTNTSDVTTDGSRGVLSGNAGAVHGATPVQLTGNAVAGAGEATAESESRSSATSGGWVLTSGADGAGTGNVAGVPVATPVKVNGNGIAGLGKADAESEATADARAGDERPGLYGVPTYLETNGDPALAAGNVVQPAASGPVMLCGNAVAGAGGSEAECESASETDAGGTNRTTGEGSVASGSVAHPVVVLPTQGFGNAAAGVGSAEAEADNTVDSTAGGDSYTRGHDSVLSGTTVAGGPAGAADVFSNAVTGAGDTEASSTNDSTSTGGGHTGTTGDNSAGGGNMVNVPVTPPVETFGNAVGAVGGADAEATETKESTSGGGSNSDDDNGLAASNVVTAPVAGAVQAFGNGAGALAFTDSRATTDNEATAGGDSNATGIGGLGSANIGQVPVTLPAQVFGTGASVLGTGQQAALANNVITSGGDATSDGSDSALSGNVVNTPAGAAAQAFGESVAALGLNDSVAASDTETNTGGVTETDGTSSLGSGNVVAPQAMPVVQSFAAVVSGVGGANSSVSDSDNENTTGGDIDTAGDDGFLSGNIADVPAGAVVQPFADAVSAIESQSVAVGDNESASTVGGTSTTSGAGGSLSGIDGTVPVGANVPVYNVPVEVLAEAITEGTNDSVLDVGKGVLLNTPVSGSDASPTRMPSLMPMTGGRSMPHDFGLPFATVPEALLAALPADDVAGSFTGMLGGFTDGMGAMPARPAVSTLADTVSEQPQILPAPVVPVAQPRSDLPFAPAAGDLFDADLPVAGDLFGDLPVTGGQFGDLPVAGGEFGDLPVTGGQFGNLPVTGGQFGHLPVAGDLVGDLPVTGEQFGDLPVTGGEFGDLPVAGDLVGDLPVTGGQFGHLPVTGDLFGDPPVETLPVEALVSEVPLPVSDELAAPTQLTGGVTDATAPIQGLGNISDITAPIQGLGNASDVTALLPATGSRSDATTVIPVIGDTIPAIPAAPAVGDVTTVIPAIEDVEVTRIIPAVPAVGDVTAIPVVQAPSLNGLPVAPAVAGVPAVDNGSLTDTRAALANLFTIHPIG